MLPTPRRDSISLRLRFGLTPIRLLSAALTISVSLFATPLKANSKPLATFEHYFFAFGTEITLLIRHHDAERVKKAQTEIETLFLELNRELNPWQLSPLNELNRALNLTGRARPSSTMVELIEHSIHFHQRSFGHFNPTLGKWVAKWKFDQAAHAPQSPPDDQPSRFSQRRSPPSLNDLRLDPPWLYTTRADLSLDFGGIAKGYALDEGIKRLQRLGIQHAIINAGGDLKVLGESNEGAWYIGIRHPRAEGALAGVQVASGEGVFTSGDYERYFDHDGRRYHHIFNSETGEPAIGIVSATVIDRSALLADAAATALVAAGAEKWKAVAQKMELERVLVVMADDTLWISRAFAQQATLLGDSLAIKLIEHPSYDLNSGGEVVPSTSEDE